MTFVRHLAVLSLVILAGCSLFRDKNAEYKGAQARAAQPLEVPPELTAPTMDDRYSIPDPRAQTSYSAYSQKVPASNAAPDEGAAKPGGTHPLDETELDILARVARGDTDRRIATALRVSERTVRRRLHLIFSKLGVASRIQAGIYAARIGLAAPDVRPTVRGG